MRPEPVTVRKPMPLRLEGKVALITGGDSGIGRAVAVAFAQAGCDVLISYLKEHIDARETKRLVEAEGRGCVLMSGDITRKGHAERLVRRTIKEYDKLDILVNNAAEQFPQKDFADVTDEQLQRTFAVNFFAPFRLAQAAVAVMKKGACIINTASITAYRGNKELVDYSATKGAMVAFTRSLSLRWRQRDPCECGGSRTDLDALIPSFNAAQVAVFGMNHHGRAGEPAEVAPAFVFLASIDAPISQAVIHPNGGEVVNG